MERLSNWEKLYSMVTGQDIREAHVLFNDLPDRYKEIIEYRFGLKDGEYKTLEATGKKYGVSKERVRQIQAKVIEVLRKRKVILEKEDKKFKA